MLFVPDLSGEDISIVGNVPDLSLGGDENRVDECPSSPEIQVRAHSKIISR